MSYKAPKPRGLSADSQFILDQCRQRLAEVLHDGPLQDLIAAQLELKAQMAAGGESEEQLAPVAAGIEAALTGLRRVIQDRKYMSDTLEGGDGSRPDLFGQLCEICTDFRAQTGLICLFEVLPEHVRFGFHVSDVVHRCIGELLTNVRKHAQATRVRISSEIRTDGSVVLAIEDDGIGFHSGNGSGNRRGKGFGLWSIDHRLAQLGGHTTIESDDGVRVQIVLPGRLLES
jgi:signal transduction histidine kinase